MGSTHLRPYWATSGRRGAGRESWRLVVAGALAGGLAVLLFQHGTLFLLQALGPKSPLLLTLFGEAPTPFSLAPHRLSGLPALIGDLLWGSLWGVVLALAIGRDRLPAAVSGALFGGVILGTLSLAAATLPLGRLPFAAPREAIALATLVHAAWGWGTAVMLRGVIRG